MVSPATGASARWLLGPRLSLDSARPDPQRDPPIRRPSGPTRRRWTARSGRGGHQCRHRRSRCPQDAAVPRARPRLDLLTSATGTRSVVGDGRAPWDGSSQPSWSSLCSSSPGLPDRYLRIRAPLRSRSTTAVGWALSDCWRRCLRSKAANSVRISAPVSAYRTFVGARRRRTVARPVVGEQRRACGDAAAAQSEFGASAHRLGRRCPTLGGGTRRH